MDGTSFNTIQNVRQGFGVGGRGGRSQLVLRWIELLKPSMWLQVLTYYSGLPSTGDLFQHPAEARVAPLLWRQGDLAQGRSAVASACARVCMVCTEVAAAFLVFCYPTLIRQSSHRPPNSNPTQHMRPRRRRITIPNRAPLTVWCAASASTRGSDTTSPPATLRSATCEHLAPVWSHYCRLSRAGGLRRRRCWQAW
jgi:hypothetical protein